MKNKITSLLCLLTLFTLGSCLVDKDPKATNSALMVSRGDIAVVSFGSDSVIIFDSVGNLKRVLYQLPASADTITGMTWNSDTNELLLSIDGTPDRIEAISPVTGIARSFYNNVTYFTGTIAAIAQLRDSGDIISSEGATVERFNSNGVRLVYSTYWPTSITANSQQLVSLSTGSWMTCSSTTGVRINVDTTTAAVTTTSSVAGPVGATATYGCGELSDGSIVVGWSGAAADYVSVYSSTLTAPTVIINNNQSLISDPRGIAIGDNDEIYITDATKNVVVQLDQTGSVIRQFGNSILSAPRHITIIPSLTP